MKMQLITAPSKCAQVADFIEKEIRSGKLRPGVRLYSMRELCGKFNSTVTVIDSAYDILEKKGLIQRFPRKGVFVAKNRHAGVRKYGLLTNVGRCMRPDYHEALFRTLSKYGGSVMPMVLDARQNWSKEVDRLVDDDPSLILIDLEAQFFDLDVLYEHIENIPHFFINRWEWKASPPEQGVFIDYEGALECALRHFLKRGHKRILFVGHDIEQTEFIRRTLSRIAERCSLEFPGPVLDYIFAYDFAINLEHTKKIFAEQPPTALFAPSDEPLFTFMNMVRLFYPKIASRIELIGFHNIIYSNIPEHEFSTFSINYDLFWDKVFARFNAKKQPVSGVEWVVPEMILRGKSLVSETGNRNIPNEKGKEK